LSQSIIYWAHARGKEILTAYRNLTIDSSGYSIEWRCSDHVSSLTWRLQLLDWAFLVDDDEAETAKRVYAIPVSTPDRRS
jgi:hypothetical protein